MPKTLGMKRRASQKGSRKKQKLFVRKALSFSSKPKNQRRQLTKAQIDRAQSIALKRLIRESKARNPELQIVSASQNQSPVVALFATGSADATWDLIHPRYDLVNQAGSTDGVDQIAGLMYRPRKWILKMSFFNTNSLAEMVQIHLVILKFGTQSNLSTNTLAKIKSMVNPSQFLSYGQAMTGSIHNFFNTRMPLLLVNATDGDTSTSKIQGDKDIRIVKSWKVNITGTNAEFKTWKSIRVVHKWRNQRFLRTNNTADTYTLEKGDVPFIMMSASGGGMQYKYTNRFYFQDV